MPGIMTLNADDSVYLSTGSYAAGRLPWFEPESPPPGDAKWCGIAAMRYCTRRSQAEYSDCSAVNCEAICERPNSSGLCAGCYVERQRCQNEVLARYADCGTCSPGSQCIWDVGQQPSPTYGYSRCCPPGQVPCNGKCVVPSCGSSREGFSTWSCRCECEEPYVRGASGACVCPAIVCPPDQPLLDASCRCQPCPAGTTASNGQCVDITSDVNNCGVIGHVCGVGEGCCSGVCASKTANGRCGTCRIDCNGPDDGCCSNRGVPTCTNLKWDPLHCGQCGNACALGLGKTCIQGTCECRPRFTPCGTDACCGPGWTCFLGMVKGSQCTCPSSHAQCGPLGESCCAAGEFCCGVDCCPGGRTCCHGECCDAGATCCGSDCCPSGRVCCNNQCCPAGQVCCGGTCTSLGTVENCSSCGDKCVYLSDDVPPVVTLGSCDSQRHCRCPAGTVSVKRDSAGGDLTCCPAATPLLCGDGSCRTQC